MKYAERVAHEAIDKARRCEHMIGGTHSEACRNAAGAVEAAIKMCAALVYGHQWDVETPSNWGQACRLISTAILAVAEREEPSPSAPPPSRTCPCGRPVLGGPGRARSTAPRAVPGGCRRRIKNNT